MASVRSLLYICSDTTILYKILMGIFYIASIPYLNVYKNSFRDSYIY